MKIPQLHLRDKLFALSFEMWRPILNLFFTKVVLAKHSTSKENNFRKLNGGPKHFILAVFGNRIVMKAEEATLLFHCSYLCPGSPTCEDVKVYCLSGAQLKGLPTAIDL